MLWEFCLSRVLVTIEHRYQRTPDGAVWSSFFTFEFWRRYLEVFDEVLVVARIEDVASVPDRWRRADGDGVSFHQVPHYHGPIQFALRAPAVIRGVRAALRPEDSVIMRVGSNLAWCMEGALYRSGHPFGVEVLADPLEIFAPDVGAHRFGRFWRWWFARQLRRQCRNAIGTAYVTKRALQKNFPPRPGRFTTNYSSVMLPPRAVLDAPRSWSADGARRTLVHVATMDDARKGHLTLIDALAQCRTRGVVANVVFVGGGVLGPEFEAHARAVGVGDLVRFTGQLPSGDAVRDELDAADVFVLPSFGEGLPRSAIEAMARGLPVIGTDIGGFRELLPVEELVPCGDVATLASSIEAMVTDPARMTAHSARNLETVQEYREEVLAPRRRALYRTVKDATEAWLQARR